MPSSFGTSKDRISTGTEGPGKSQITRTIFPAPYENIRKALRDTRHWDGDLHQTVGDGSMVIVSSRCVVRNTETNDLQILERNRGITTQKKAGEAFLGVSRQLASRVEELQLSERRFRAFVDLAPGAVVIADGSGKIVLVNLQTEKQFGYTRDELVGESLEMLLPARFRTRHPKHRSEYLSSPHVGSMTQSLALFGLRKSGGVPCRNIAESD